MITLAILGLLAVSGWGACAWLWRTHRALSREHLALCRERDAHVCPVEPPTRAVLLSPSGLPECMRHLKGAAPATYSRPHGKEPATIYQRVGTAAVYQPTT